MQSPTSPLHGESLGKIRTIYREIFSVHEIETNVTLQLFFGAMLFYFYVTFYQWMTTSQLASDVRTVCWPYFTDCNSLHFFSRMPASYSQNIFYMILLTVMLWIAYDIYARRWSEAHFLMLLLLVWKTVASFLMSWGLAGVYDYYHIILTSTLLLFPYKEYFTKVQFVLLYFLSSTIKFYPTWILGTYFTSLHLGLPIFPDALTPLITNFVIFEQVVGCWFLLSKNRLVQRLTLAYSLLFHLYGGVLVIYNYSSLTLPALLILFGPRYRHQRPPLTRASIAGWVFVALIVVFQMPAHFIRGDEKITMEGFRFGMWMFDANHQCVVDFKTYFKPGVEKTPWYYKTPTGTPCLGNSCISLRSIKKEGTQWVSELQLESPKAEYRCSPYTAWQQYINLCDTDVERVAFTFDHSINGGPFYRIVDVPDMCHLTYKAFGHNDWIKEPPEAQAVGLPAENVYFY